MEVQQSNTVKGKKVTKKVTKKAAAPVETAAPAKKVTKKVAKKAEVVEPEPVVEVPAEEPVAVEEATEDTFSYDAQVTILENQMKEMELEFRNKMRVLKDGLKHLSKCHTIEKRNQKKKRKNSSNTQTGAKMPMVINDKDACKFLGIEVGGQASRADLMRKIYGYVADHGLKHEDNKRVFSIKGDLASLFPDVKEMKHQQVMGAISRFFPKKGSN